MLTSSPDSVEKQLEVILTELVCQDIPLHAEELRCQPKHGTNGSHHADDGHVPVAQMREVDV